MLKNPYIVLFAILGTLVFLFSYLMANNAYASTLVVDVPSDVSAYDDAPLSSSTVALLIHAAAFKYGVNEQHLYATLKCESMVDGVPFDTNAVGDNDSSFGVAQIHLIAHPDIPRAAAMDGAWSIDWAAQQFSEGNAHWWSCWRHLYAIHT